MTDNRPNPDVALIGLAAALSAGELPSPELRAWFTERVKAWLSGVPIEHALQVRRTASYARRDVALRAAAALLGNDPARLAEAIARHARRRSTDTPLDRHLGEAFASGRTVPTSIKQLRRIIRDGIRA